MKGLMENALAPSTRRAYLNRISKFKNFSRDLGRKTSKLFGHNTIELWLTSLDEKNITHNTALTHLSAISFYCTSQGIEHKLDITRIKLMLKGMEKKVSKPSAPIVSIYQLKCCLK